VTPLEVRTVIGRYHSNGTAVSEDVFCGGKVASGLKNSSVEYIVVMKSTVIHNGAGLKLEVNANEKRPCEDSICIFQNSTELAVPGSS
jgi:hypothetical protein